MTKILSKSLKSVDLNCLALCLVMSILFFLAISMLRGSGEDPECQLPVPAESINISRLRFFTFFFKNTLCQWRSADIA
jgi:hypothetical protein